jgi:glycogen synthase
MANPDYVFEVSFEVCNKIGGIYTVVSTKAQEMVKYYKERYYTVGFYDADKAKLEFEEENPPEGLSEAFRVLEEEGIKCFFGIWHIPGKPQTILVDARQSKTDVNYLKKKYWERYGIDSLKSDSWFNDPLIWSYAVGRLLEETAKKKPYNGANIVGHFHEWLSGFALLHIKEEGIPVRTVFTTHATMLGRSISAKGDDLHRMVSDGLRSNETATVDTARRYGCQDKHTTEVACAKNADVFTTVSDVTGREAEYILGLKPQVILYNGLDLSGYEELEDLAFKRAENRRIMRGFLRAFFSRYYEMDYYKIRSAFISGRYEYHNKGIDIFIDALGKLNKKLREENADGIFLAFIFVPTGITGENIQILKNKALYDDITEHIDSEWPRIREKLIELATSGIKTEDAILTEIFSEKLRKLSQTFVKKYGTNPPISAFDFSYPEGQDNIVNALKRNNLLNREGDKVKVVFYPTYLSEVDKLITMGYNDATLTCDVGVFPSYYEPWGYTPLETIAQGTPTITSDLAGFGQFISGKGNGVKVLKMDGTPYEQIVEELQLALYDIFKTEKRDLTKMRMSAKELSSLADWKNLAKNYNKAHQLALEKK